MGRRATLGIAKTYPGSSSSTPPFIYASTGSDYAGVTGREDKNCTRRSCQMHSATVDILRFHRSFEDACCHNADSEKTVHDTSRHTRNSYQTGGSVRSAACDRGVVNRANTEASVTSKVLSLRRSAEKLRRRGLPTSHGCSRVFHL